MALRNHAYNRCDGQRHRDAADDPTRYGHDPAREHGGKANGGEGGGESIYIKGVAMNLQIVKWGNSLALRIPADYARQIGLKEGDQVQANLTVDGGISIRAARWDRNAFAQELASMREAMPMTRPVTEVLRRGARY